MQTEPARTNEWLGKEEVAELLDKSIRTVLNMAKEGTIKSKLERNPKTGHKNVLFDAEDARRLRDQPDPPLMRKPAVVQVDAPASFAPIREAPASPRPWLTLDEAAEFSGLTKRWLLAEAEREPKAYGIDIAVRDMGKHSPGGRWRFHRESLAR